MPKAPKFYAVSKGREGPKVYDNWDEVKENVSRYPGATHKSFPTAAQAETCFSFYAISSF
ncbi:hypothetical protein B0H15DRAFT_324997 [Mycena belliarum]|uniref:Ribonuclease H1 N-terminal domain-containing protein n=1 Tax=Mycena belliarum TaxID=1033014 RepID=A0AAD6Y144_9AGAR|nr:hypothetical protein B0H15DRAFT_324997 [Mycena belliae]